MLRSFRLANHKSIRDEQELSLLPIYDRDRPAVPVAAIYGANASGKSNLLDGLRFMREAVVGSFSAWEPGKGVPRQPFRLDAEARSAPSHYVVDVELAGVRYTYGFILDDEKILEEWLYSYPEKRRRIIFERRDGDIKFGTTVAPHRSAAEVLEGLTRSNALFLSTAAQANFSPSLPIYEWFRSALFFHYLGDDWGRDSMIDFLAETPARRQTVRSLLHLADLGIDDFRVQKEVDPILSQFGITKRIVFVHKGSDTPFEMRDESAGTRAWLFMLHAALAALEVGGSLVVDEIDTSLHSRLTARLLATFQDPDTNPRRAQLIFTTHDTSLLSSTLGEQVLRRDQVWFTEKDDHGRTSIYPLSDFKPRKGENTARRYLSGSYGAVPVVFPEDFAEVLTAAELKDVPDEA